jgi:hypothetical protein
MVGGTSNDLSYGITKICAVPVGRIIAHSAGWASFTVCQMPTAPISHVCSLKAPSMDISHSIKARDRSGGKLQLCKVDQVRLVGKRETSRK